MTALLRDYAREDHLDAESLEQLVLICLRRLANLAQSDGQKARAARLLDAATLLHDQLPPSGSDELTSRQSEVASLITRGYSNRQIAHQLVISERTVDSHVSNILRKLALGSRAQIAAWVAGRQPRLRIIT